MVDSFLLPMSTSEIIMVIHGSSELANWKIIYQTRFPHISDLVQEHFSRSKLSWV